jgi:rubrerythrin
MSISTKEELEFLLHRGLDIEKKFELMSAWKGFVTVDSSRRKIVLILARESNKHALDLEKMLKTLGLKLPADELVQEIFDFEGMLDSEVLYKIIRQDEIAADIYSELVEKTDPKLVRSLSGIDDTSFFYQTLKQIIEDEKRHVSMVKSLTGNIIRVQ